MDREQLMRQWWETTYSFAQAVTSRNGEAISTLSTPESEVDLAYRVFGFAPLLFLMKGHLKHQSLTASRAAWDKETGENVRIELLWINDQGQPAPDSQATFHLHWMQPGWRVSRIRPVGLGTSLDVEDAREMWAAGTGDESAIGIVAGTIQLQRDGPESLDDVEERLVAGLQEHRFGLSEIVTAVRLWRDFRAQAQPAYRKPAGYAAAVEYIVCLLGLYEGSQAQAGEFYGVSKSTVARNYREIRDSLKLVQFDPRYTLFEDPLPYLAATEGPMGDNAPPAIPLGFGRAPTRRT